MNVSFPGAAALLSAALGAAALRACHFAWSVHRAHRICDACVFEPSYVAPRTTRRALLVGDSTAVGIGASDRSETLAGRLVARFPSTGVEIHARSGARGRDVRGQLERAAAPSYDAVLIAVGGNDILRGTALAVFRAALDAALGLACRLSSVVIVVNCPNVGAAPLFPWPLTQVLSRRSLRYRAAFDAVCAGHPVEFVNFCFEPECDPIRRHRALYFASDGLHPSPAAYALCLARLQTETRLVAALD